MKARIVAISSVLIIVLALPPAIEAQDAPMPTYEWASLKAVPSGDQVVVKLKDGATVEGKLSSVSEEVLRLVRSDKPIDLNRTEILKVYRVRGMSAGTSTLIGAGVGAGVGAAIGAATGRDKRPDEPCAPGGFGCPVSKPRNAAVLAIPMAALGALVGLAVGKYRHKRVLIYEAKP